MTKTSKQIIKTTLCPTIQQDESTYMWVDMSERNSMVTVCIYLWIYWYFQFWLSNSPDLFGLSVSDNDLVDNMDINERLASQNSVW